VRTRLARALPAAQRRRTVFISAISGGVVII
jgi:hypothetical protein